MHHGWYKGTHLPWVMDCTTVDMVHRFHAPWIVQGYQPSMGHGLYKGTQPPWGMDCTTVDKVHGLHAPWIVQWYLPPWCMDCTRVLNLHGAWIVQQQIGYMVSPIYIVQSNTHG